MKRWEFPVAAPAERCSQRICQSKLPLTLLKVNQTKLTDGNAMENRASVGMIPAIQVMKYRHI
jgi:hypothetical protein